MKQILKTTLLEYDKSTFLIDLVQHESEKIYVSILQTIQGKENLKVQQEIKINPSVLGDIINVLQKYQPQIPQKKTKGLLSELQQSQIRKKYFKGISITELTTQFDCKQELIEQVLRNKGIEIVYDNTTNFKKSYHKNKKQRRGF